MSTVDVLFDYLTYYWFTLTSVFLILLLFVVHHRGTQINRKIAQKTTKDIHQFLTRTFSEEYQLMVQSPNVIKLYASGRDSCLFAIFAYALVPRQQILSFLFNSIWIRMKDQLVIEIPILSKHPISLTMAIIRKKNLRLITKKDYPDIKKLCKEYKPINNTHNVPESHSILVEKIEHVQYLLANEKEVELWKQHGKSVKMFYMSDINKYSRYSMAIRMVINIGEDLLPLLNWVIAFVDRMSKARMSAGERKQARLKRTKLQIKYQG